MQSQGCSAQPMVVALAAILYLLDIPTMQISVLRESATNPLLRLQELTDKCHDQYSRLKVV